MLTAVYKVGNISLVPLHFMCQFPKNISRRKAVLLFMGRS